jgi:CBS-domain-containing membrane protein
MSAGQSSRIRTWFAFSSSETSQTKPWSVITRPAATALENTSIEMALEPMAEGGFRRMPVVNYAGKLVGLVTLDDYLLLLAEELNQASKVLTRQAPRAVASG